MITKNRRLAIILELVNIHSPSSQSKLLKLLHDRGFVITQTTLSRDIKQLKISKITDDNGNLIYTAPHQDTNYSSRFPVKDKQGTLSNRGFISIDFSHQLGVIKTRQGYANGFATEIKNHATSLITGVIADDDTVLIIPKEGVTRQEVLDKLVTIIPGIKRDEEFGVGHFKSKT